MLSMQKTIVTAPCANTQSHAQVSIKNSFAHTGSHGDCFWHRSCLHLRIVNLQMKFRFLSIFEFCCNIGYGNALLWDIFCGRAFDQIYVCLCSLSRLYLLLTIFDVLVASDLWRIVCSQPGIIDQNQRIRVFVHLMYSVGVNPKCTFIDRSSVVLASGVGGIDFQSPTAS